MTDWRFKIHAYLHDPPDKPFALARGEGHAAWGQKLAEMIAGGAEEGWTDYIQRADWLASGADRSLLLPRTQPSLSDLRHPLSGQGIDLSRFGEIGAEAEKQAHEALLEEFGKLAAFKDDPALGFVALWCLLPWHLKSRQGKHELGALWDWLPAETRMPNHPVPVHQSLTSALASILLEGDEPSILSFTFGPVQKFIETARRTTDLWGGSALLSSALLQATIPLVSQIGPDHVLFPNLRRSDQFLRWLLLESEWKDKLRESYAPPQQPEGAPLGLPNRFLAVVPSEKAQSIAAACESSVRAWWRQCVIEAARVLEKEIPDLQEYPTMAKSQGDAFLKVFWAATPWPAARSIEPNDDACRRAAWIKGKGLPESTARFIGAAPSQPVNRSISVFKPNGGILYAAAYESAETLIAAVKRTRRPASRTESGLKCSLCGERSVFPSPVSFEEQKEIWRQGTASLRREGHLRRGEALCGVCWTKRLFGKKGQHVPSTAEIAASPFKLNVLQSFSCLEREVAALVSSLKDGAPKFLDSYVVPVLIPEKKSGGLRGIFAGVSGEILLGYPRERQDLEEESGSVIPDHVFRCVRELRGAARKIKIPPPRPYLAVLVMDGDEMGKWLSGAKNRKLRDYLSKEAADQLGEEGAEEYLDIGWPMTPAMHGSFSEACAVFSQRTALRTLHEESLPAFLVYAGGDDVLALSPVGCHSAEHATELATEAVFNLRMRFSGHVSRRGPGDIPDPETESGFVLDSKDGISLAFGKFATASAGLAVFHHKWPLNRALAEARRAEEYAKNELGRDALAISILRRSGQTTFTGLKFFPTERKCAIGSLQTVCHSFAFDYLSPRFLTEVRGRLNAFHGGLDGDRLLGLAEPIVKQALEAHCQDKGKLQVLVDALMDLKAAAHGKKESGTEAPGLPPDYNHLMRWIDLIEAAAFLGRGEEP